MSFTAEHIAGLVADLVGGDEATLVSELSRDPNLLAVSGFNSTTLVQLVAELEEVFDIEFEDRDMNVELLTRLDRLAEMVDRLSSATIAEARP